MQPSTSQGRQNDSAWQALAYFNLYRLFIAALFGALLFASPIEQLFRIRNLELAAICAVIYLALAAVSVMSRGIQRFPFLAQVWFALATDIVMILLLMYGLGGVSSGVGILLVITLASGALLLPGRLAIGFAAIATLCLLAVHTYGQLTTDGAIGSYTQAGLLGMGYFGTAVLGYVLAQRAQISEVLAQERGVDLANLGQVNELIIQRMRTGTLVIDQRDRIWQVNESAWYLLGMPNPQQRVLRQVSPELQERLHHWRTTGEHLNHPLSLAAGVPTVSPRFAALGATGKARATLVFLEDTSAVAQRAIEMNLASLGKLAGSIAHEIRNPLGAISHAGQLLSESELTTEDKRLVEIIHQQTRRMNEIVEDVLQISRRERCRPERLQLNPWLKTFVREFRDTHKVAPLGLTREVQPDELTVTADPGHLHQVVWNLCENALRYGHPPDKKTRTQLRAAPSEGAGGVILDISDHGPGIEPEHVTHIFEPFYTSSTRGSGLGLYISKQLCEANQATLEYIPIPTGGSCFRITFPRPREEVVVGAP